MDLFKRFLITILVFFLCKPLVQSQPLAERANIIFDITKILFTKGPDLAKSEDREKFEKIGLILYNQTDKIIKSKQKLILYLEGDLTWDFAAKEVEKIEKILYEMGETLTKSDRLAINAGKDAIDIKNATQLSIDLKNKILINKSIKDKWDDSTPEKKKQKNEMIAQLKKGINVLEEAKENLNGFLDEISKASN